jgi:hypothetical protein
MYGKWNSRSWSITELNKRKSYEFDLKRLKRLVGYKINQRPLAPPTIKHGMSKWLNWPGPIGEIEHIRPDKQIFQVVVAKKLKSHRSYETRERTSSGATNRFTSSQIVEVLEDIRWTCGFPKTIGADKWRGVHIKGSIGMGLSKMWRLSFFSLMIPLLSASCLVLSHFTESILRMSHYKTRKVCGKRACRIY